MSQELPRQDRVMLYLQRVGRARCVDVRYEVGGTHNNAEAHLHRLARLGLTRQADDQQWELTRDGREWTPTPRAPSNKHLILTALHALGSSDGLTIGNAAGVAYGSTTRSLWSLHRNGFVAPVRKGVWALTAEGEAELAKAGEVTLRPRNATRPPSRPYVEMDAYLTRRVTEAAEKERILPGCWIRNIVLKVLHCSPRPSRHGKSGSKWAGRSTIGLTPSEQALAENAAGLLGFQAWVRCVVREALGMANVWTEHDVTEIVPRLATGRGDPPAARRNWSLTVTAPSFLPEGVIPVREALKRLGVVQPSLFRALRAAGVPLLELSGEDADHRCVYWEQAQHAMRNEPPGDPLDVRETAKQAALRLGMHEGTLRNRLVKAGVAPAQKKRGLRWSLTRREIDAALKP